MAQAVAIQQALLKDINDPKTTAIARAASARAWDVLEDRKRVLRGIPNPGQFRPDIDPVKLAKRLRDRSVIETTSYVESMPHDGTRAIAETSAQPEPEKPAEPQAEQEFKKSLKPQGG